MFARIDLYHLWFILSEVEAFSRVNFTANSDLKILVGYFPIAVKVKLVKEVAELIVS